MMFFGMLAGWTVLAGVATPLIGIALRSGQAQADLSAGQLVAAVDDTTGWR